MQPTSNGLLKDSKTFTLGGEEVILFDPQDEDNEDLLAVDEHLELRADLKEAFEHFSVLQQRILFRVLVQGLTLRKATARFKTPLRTWQRWLKEEAMPKLRDLLSDYASDVKEVHRTIPTPTVEDTSNDNINTVSCKICGNPFTGKGERAFQKLSSHFSKEHRSEFKKIKKYVATNNRDLSRMEEEIG